MTTARGRELLADPEALLELLHDDLGGDGFDGDAWRSSRRCCTSTGRWQTIA